jgi:hypothetical protein
MCTTSAEYKTIITVVLTVMSGIDHHKISQDSSWFRNGLVQFGFGYGRPQCDSVVHRKLGFPVRAKISWSNHLVGAEDSVWSYPVRVGDSLSFYPVRAGVSVVPRSK